MAREKSENQEFVVKVNSVWTITAKDELDAHDKVVHALGLMRPAGTVSRRIRWSNVKPLNGQPATKEKE